MDEAGLRFRWRRLPPLTYFLCESGCLKCAGWPIT